MNAHAEKRDAINQSLDDIASVLSICNMDRKQISKKYVDKKLYHAYTCTRTIKAVGVFFKKIEKLKRTELNWTEKKGRSIQLVYQVLSLKLQSVREKKGIISCPSPYP